MDPMIRRHDETIGTWVDPSITGTTPYEFGWLAGWAGADQEPPLDGGSRDLQDYIVGYRDGRLSRSREEER